MSLRCIFMFPLTSRDWATGEAPAFLSALFWFCFAYLSWQQGLCNSLVAIESCLLSWAANVPGKPANYRKGQTKSPSPRLWVNRYMKVTLFQMTSRRCPTSYLNGSFKVLLPRTSYRPNWFYLYLQDCKEFKWVCWFSILPFDDELFYGFLNELCGTFGKVCLRKERRWRERKLQTIKGRSEINAGCMEKTIPFISRDRKVRHTFSAHILFHPLMAFQGNILVSLIFWMKK